MDTRLAISVDMDKLPEGFDTRAFMAELGDRARRFMDDRFWSDMGESGPWAPLADSTWAQKTTSKMLVESGEYYGSWVQSQPDDMTVIISSESRLAKWHERGTSKMPARPFIFLTDEEVDKIMEFVAKQLGDALNA